MMICLVTPFSYFCPIFFLAVEMAPTEYSYHTTQRSLDVYGVRTYITLPLNYDHICPCSPSWHIMLLLEILCSSSIPHTAG